MGEYGTRKFYRIFMLYQAWFYSLPTTSNTGFNADKASFCFPHAALWSFFFCFGLFFFGILKMFNCSKYSISKKNHDHHSQYPSLLEDSSIHHTQHLLFSMAKTRVKDVHGELQTDSGSLFQKESQHVMSTIPIPSFEIQDYIFISLGEK